jgi:hypothetical protein
MCCDLAQTALATHDLSRQTIFAQLLLQSSGLGLVSSHREARTMDKTERPQLGKTAETGECEDSVTIRVTRNDIQRAETDRTSSAKNGYL